MALDGEPRVALGILDVHGVAGPGELGLEMERHDLAVVGQILIVPKDGYLLVVWKRLHLDVVLVRGGHFALAAAAQHGVGVVACFALSTNIVGGML